MGAANRRRLWNGALFLALAAAVWTLVLRQVSLPDLGRALAAAGPAPLLGAAGAMGLYFLLEAWNTARGLRRFGYDATLGQGLQYAAADFFYSALTPSSTGGQPMAIHRMRRHGVAPAHGALVLLLELACWKVAAAALGLLGLFRARETLRALPGPARAVLAAGVGLNLAVLAAVLLALLRPGWAKALGRRAAARLAGRPRAARLWDAAGTQLDRFAEAAPQLRRQPGFALSALALTAGQLLALYSVSWFSARALGAADCGFWTAAAAQAAVNLAVSALPLPGAMGAGEGGFLLFFAPLLPPDVLPTAMLLARSLSFYLPVPVTGLCLLFGRRSAVRVSNCESA